MRAGKLRHKITIEQLTTVHGGDGGTTETWQKFIEASAAIEPLSGREMFAAGVERSEVTNRIRLRYRKGITAAMRVVYKKRMFDIQAVIDIRSEHRELHLMCKEYGDD